MVASRYQTSFGYAPRMATGAYQGGRNALAPVYSAPPAGSVGGPVGLPQAPGMAAPAPSAPSLTSGTGALSGGAMRQNPEGNGVGYGDPGDQYGGPGPTGAPSTGNFGQDLAGFGRNAGGFVGMALGGPMGIAAATAAALGIGAINAFAPETARAVFSDVFGMPGVSSAAPMGNLGDTPTPAGGNFGAGANVTGGNFVDPSMTSMPDVAAAPVGPTSMDGITGNPDGALGNLGDYGTPAGGNFGDGANSAGGEGMNSGGESNTSDGTAGMGSSESGNGWRYGGYTGHGEDGTIDPYEVAGPVHEGEYVLRHEATQHYGPELLHALNSGTIPVNALMGLAMARRPTASNHLLQMMMR